MAFATATTIGLITAAASTGASLYNAHKGAAASKEAAAAQVASGDRAAQLQYMASQDSMNFAKQAWAQQRQDTAPWLNYGRGAVTMLGDLMGVPSMPSGDVAAQGSDQSQNQQQSKALGPMPGPQPTGPGSRPGWANTVPTGWLDTRPQFEDALRQRGYTWPGSDQPAPQTGGAPSMASMYGGGDVVAPPSTNSRNGGRGMTRVRWSDGTESTVATKDLDQYQSLGAEAV